MGIEVYEEGKLLMVQSRPLHAVLWECITDSGTSSLIFIDVNVDKSSRMNFEVFRAISSAYI